MEKRDTCRDGAKIVCIARTLMLTGRTSYPVLAYTDAGPYPISNFNEMPIDLQDQAMIVVSYLPADQFCQYVPLTRMRT